jgi:hypothetical protein
MAHPHNHMVTPSAHNDELTVSWCSPLKVEGLLTKFGSRLSPVLSDSLTCRRFLIANKGNIDHAGEALLATQVWRRAETPWWPSKSTPLSCIDKDISSGKAYIHGVDGEGAPITWVRASLHDKHEDRASLKHFLAFLNDESVARLPTLKSSDDESTATTTTTATNTTVAEGMVIVVDFRGFGYSSFDPGAGIAIVQMLSAYFPERLKSLLFVNPPSLFSFFWAIVKPFVDARTSRKIQFVKQDVLDEALGITRANIPVFLGGTSPYIYDKSDVQSYETVKMGSLRDFDETVRCTPWGALE